MPRKRGNIACVATVATFLIGAAFLLNTESSVNVTYSLLRRKLEAEDRKLKLNEVGVLSTDLLHRTLEEDRKLGLVDEDIEYRKLEAEDRKLELDEDGAPVLPSHLQNNLDAVTIDHQRDHGTPFFFHILKSGGTTVKDLYTTCYRKVVANEVGGRDGMGEEDVLQIVDKDGARYVNVDTTEWEGILRAKRLGFAGSRMADVVFSPHVNEVASELFTPEVPGKCFAIFRDPVERAISLYYYLQKATWEPTYNPELQNMSLEAYSNSTLVESNWMVRTLSGKREGKLTEEDIMLAMEVVEEKCLVGLLSHFEESLDRFDTYFGFRPDDDEATQCRNELLFRGGSNVGLHKREELDPKSLAVKNIQRKNRADSFLYSYVQELFEVQRLWFENGEAAVSA